jgi:uncharacterized membrane protein
MGLVAFWLVLASAALHVFWNTLVKQCGDKLSFAWLTTVAGSLALLPPFLVWRTVSTGSLGPEVFFWAGVSGLLETLYVACLFGAYSASDLSAVYPLSRGAAPVFALLLAGVLVGDWVSPAQGLAVGVVVAGTLVVGLSTWQGCPATLRLRRQGLLLSLATGGAIAGYHLADRKALSLSPAPDPLDYLFVMHLFMSLFVTAWAWRRRPSWSGLASAWLTSSWRNGRRAVVLVAVCTPLSYFLIVLALRQGNVVHVTAARNVGVLLSTLVGAVLLRERVSRTRALGSVLIVAGLAGLALLGG